MSSKRERRAASEQLRQLLLSKEAPTQAARAMSVSLLSDEASSPRHLDEMDKLLCVPSNMPLTPTHVLDIPDSQDDLSRNSNSAHSASAGSRLRRAATTPTHYDAAYSFDEADFNKPLFRSPFVMLKQEQAALSADAKADDGDAAHFADSGVCLKDGIGCSLAPVLDTWILWALQQPTMVKILAVWLVLDPCFWMVNSILKSKDVAVLIVYNLSLLSNAVEFLLAALFLYRLKGLLASSKWFVMNEDFVEQFRVRLREVLYALTAGMFVLMAVSIGWSMQYFSPLISGELGWFGTIYGVISVVIVEMIQILLPGAAMGVVYVFLELLTKHARSFDARNFKTDRGLLLYWRDLTVRLDGFSWAVSPFLATYTILFVVVSISLAADISGASQEMHSLAAVWNFTFAFAHLIPLSMVIARCFMLTRILSSTCTRESQRFLTHLDKKGDGTSSGSITLLLLLQTAPPTFKIFSVSITTPLLQSLAAGLGSALLAVARVISD